MRRNLHAVCCLIGILTLCLFASVSLAEDTKILTIGWDTWEPYLYEENGQLTGLDVELSKIVFEKAGYELSFKQMPWKRHLKELENGKIDLASSASKTSEREAYAYFSDPYRMETAVLLVRKGESGKFDLKSLDDIVPTKFRLGITRGYYYGEKFEELIKIPEFKKQCQDVANDETHFAMLINNRTDGFLSDPFSGMAILRKKGLTDKIETHPMPVYSDNIHVMFGKKSMSPDIVVRFNEALKKLKAEGEIDRIIKKYLE